MSSRFSAQELLRLPVRWNGVELGRLTDLFLAPDGRRVLGFEVLCGDGRPRFLPSGAGSLTDGEISVRSALLLFGDAELAFYRRRGRPFTSQRGRPVERGRSVIGRLLDVVLAADGTIVDVVVDGARGPEHLGLDDSVRLPSREKAA